MTRLLAYLEEAIAALWRNRARSILTMLGMIIGSASIIAVFGISRAATSGITGTFASFGTLPVSVLVDQSQDYPAQAAIAYRDAATVANALGTLAIAVQPTWQRTGKIAAGSINAYESVVSTGAYHDDSTHMASGRRIDRADVTSGARVCVLTADLGRKFFPHGNAVGSYLRIKGERFLVIGVWQQIQGSFFAAITSGAVLIPYTTFHDVFTPGPVDSLTIYPAQNGNADAVGRAAIAALQHIHGRRAKYRVENSAAFVTSFDNVLNIIAVGLSAIGGVALVVAGIGIMNIMLVSVTERTREIGIRKAIGASRANITLQFLMEAIVLSLIGGGIGMGIGVAITVGAASLLSKQLGVLLIPYLLIVSVALGFSIAVGMVFGTYPALRAAALDPIEALRS